MSDSDEFEYESDDDPYGGAEEEAFELDTTHLVLVVSEICWRFTEICYWPAGWG